MGHRLSKIYTRTGDSGSTGLGEGSRVAKDHPRVEAGGTVDELNSAIGALLAQPLPGPVQECLTQVQHDLFDVGGELSIPGYRLITPEHTQRLEEQLDRFNSDLPPLQEFILPGGGAPAAAAHVARAVCRRAERRVVTLDHDEQVNTDTLAYLNRLSDLLFVIARLLARAADERETEWQRDRDPR